jgi:enamine deaminase RidA (YjgF/YER057c/UK114 family)
MSKVELIRSTTLTDEVAYAYAATVPAGGTLVFTAGACPLDDDGEVTAIGDFAGQARVTMDNLVAALAASGATLADVAKSTVYVASADRSKLVEVWEVVAERFGGHDAPSTLLGVALLGYPDQLVEVEVIAVRP